MMWVDHAWGDPIGARVPAGLGGDHKPHGSSLPGPEDAALWQKGGLALADALPLKHPTHRGKGEAMG